MSETSPLLRHETAQDSGASGQLIWGATPAAVLWTGDRRLEASTYLSDGYGLRSAIMGRAKGWRPLQELAEVWQPSRLKGITVSPDYGTPFLSAGQVFETRPTPRKWLSLGQTDTAQARFVEPGWLLVTCSGNVGRVTAAYEPHLTALITHDLLRVQPNEDAWGGWLYAYMKTAVFRAIATASHYGHVIKHLEPSHLMAMPIVLPSLELRDRCAGTVARIFSLRTSALRAITDAEDAYARAWGNEMLTDVTLDQPVAILASELSKGRRRLDAYHSNPVVRRLESSMPLTAIRVESVRDVTRRVWWPDRFRRPYGPNGTPYVSAEDLFNFNAVATKRVYTSQIPEVDNYRLRPGWLLMARSGQIYGLNGSVMVATRRHNEYIVSEDLIRIEPDESRIRWGYLLTVLTHPELGRPMVIRHAYGTSIPHLEPADVGDIPVPRFSPAVEDDIAGLMEAAAAARAEADELEDVLVAEAQDLATNFLHATD